MKCLGRKPAHYNRKVFRSAMTLGATLDGLGAPPPESVDWTAAVFQATGGDWGGMHGNDRLGDCTIADTANQILLHTANAGRFTIPSDQDVEAAYYALTGGADDGCVETDVLSYMQRAGLAGQKIDLWGSVNPANLDHIKWCVQLFGACRLGIFVDAAMIQQFESYQPWTAAAASPIGGHDVPVVKYDGDWLYVVTWNRIQRVSAQLLADPKFCEEAHSELWLDWIRQQSGTAPNDFSLDKLAQDLAAIGD